MAKKPIGGLTAAMLGDATPALAEQPPAAVQADPQADPQAGKPIAITGKLAPALYLRLKTYGAANRLSNQDIIVAALTEYLDRHG